MSTVVLSLRELLVCRTKFSRPAPPSLDGKYGAGAGACKYSQIHMYLWPLAKYISNTFEAYNPGGASNTAKYICIWPLPLPLAKYGPQERAPTAKQGERESLLVRSALFLGKERGWLGDETQCGQWTVAKNGGLGLGLQATED
eukprot:scaffold226374_cov29-Tisochrysis_lutea.AAC.1